MKRRKNPLGYSSLTRSEAFQILGLDPSATIDQAKRAWRDAAKRHHPDVGGDPELFRKSTEAWEVIKGALQPAAERRRDVPRPPPPPPSYEPTPVVRGPGIIKALQELQAIARASLQPSSRYKYIMVRVQSRVGPYTANLLDLIVDMQNGRDILEGPAPEPEPSVWDED